MPITFLTSSLLFVEVTLRVGGNIQIIFSGPLIVWQGIGAPQMVTSPKAQAQTTRVERRDHGAMTPRLRHARAVLRELECVGSHAGVNGAEPEMLRLQ